MEGGAEGRAFTSCVLGPIGTLARDLLAISPSRSPPRFNLYLRRAYHLAVHHLRVLPIGELDLHCGKRSVRSPRTGQAEAPGALGAKSSPTILIGV
eukprot:747802-Hanusia_phi.AAC.5